MKFGKFLMSAGWLVLGVVIVTVSLWQNQRSVVWGSAKQNLVFQNLEMDHGDLDKEVQHLVVDLPEPAVMPGNWLYPIKAAHDWAWWTMAGSEAEKSRRWLQLANERLKMGWDLCHRGETSKAVETYGKAEMYLQRAMNSGLDSEELDQVVETHYLVLKSVEKYIPEELRPRITEALNVTRSEWERIVANGG